MYCYKPASPSSLIQAIALLLCFIASSAVAHNNVVVIPMGGDSQSLKQIIIVAKENGEFSDPVAALASIDDASSDKPYLVFIAPGVYTLDSQLKLKPYIDVVGSGQNVTRLTGTISSGSRDHSAALVTLKHHTLLANLSIENMGGSNHSMGIYAHLVSRTAMLRGISSTATGSESSYGIFNDFASPLMSGVTASAANGSNAYGVYNYYYSSPTMNGVTAKASNGSVNYAVYNHRYADPIINNITAVASGGTVSRGIYNDDHSDPVIIGGTYTAISGSSSNIGVQNYNYSKPTLSGALIKASGAGGTSNYGVVNTIYSAAVIRRCTIEAGIALQASTTSTNTVSQSTIKGSVDDSGTNSNTACVASDNGAGLQLGPRCI